MIYTKDNNGYTVFRMASNKGENHYGWKGDNAKYGSIHDWLRYHYGLATKCEENNCTGVYTRFEWALKKGKKYEHNRENFIQLCRSCHVKYDKRVYKRAEETKRKISKKLKGFFQKNKMSTETRQKMAVAQQIRRLRERI